MSITDWPKEDRPREKLISKGEQSLTDAELISICIQNGTRGKTALDIAKELLTEHGGLKKLLRQPVAYFMQKTGLGSAKYAALKAAKELGKRYLAENIAIGETLSSSRLTQQFVTSRLREHRNEVFACLFLDTHFRLISFEELFHGTINEANVYPREIVQRCLVYNAAKIILAHNHPSGNPQPSQADKQITTLIRQALNLISIEVVDHIIIGNPENFSFAEAGLI